ncbi:hypothetical protein FRC12_017793 [Ceratobasidium sp. 428]|nr:hypothetical protein FRC12_017793 [Ceratobasidium sp. 428]
MPQHGNLQPRESSQQDIKPEVTQFSILDGAEQDEEFNFMDGNIHLKVENCVFFVHKFKLAKFRKIKTAVLSHDEIALEGSAGDFRSILRVMYTSFDSPVRFEVTPPVLISTLRVATRYDHPELRAFAIQQLETNCLPILDYLPLAREFDVLEWETQALDHLVSRDKPITEAEAKILGAKLFVATAVRREERLTRKWKSAKPPSSTTTEASKRGLPSAFTLFTTENGGVFNQEQGGPASIEEEKD